MSAYSDWKYGLITDSEYNSICLAEDRRDEYYRKHPELLQDDEDEEEDPDDDIDEW